MWQCYKRLCLNLEHFLLAPKNKYKLALFITVNITVYSEKYNTGSTKIV